MIADAACIHVTWTASRAALVDVHQSGRRRRGSSFASRAVTFLCAEQMVVLPTYEQLTYPQFAIYEKERRQNTEYLNL